MKLKRIGELKELLSRECYDKVVIWEDGSWASVSSSYGGELDGDNPIITINRCYYYDLTRKEISQIIKAIKNGYEF